MPFDEGASTQEMRAKHTAEARGACVVRGARRALLCVL